MFVVICSSAIENIFSVPPHIHGELESYFIYAASLSNGKNGWMDERYLRKVLDKAVRNVLDSVARLAHPETYCVTLDRLLDLSRLWFLCL